MKKKVRNMLIIAGLILTSIFGIAGLGVYKIYSWMPQIQRDESTYPDDLKEPRVLKNVDFLKKTEVFEKDHPGFIDTVIKGVSLAQDKKQRDREIGSDVAKGIYNYSHAKMCGKEIIFAGEFGAYFLDENGKFLRQITFEPSERKSDIAGGYEHTSFKINADKLQIVDLDNDGKCEFVAYGSTSGVSVFNSHGDLAWEYGKETFNASNVWRDEKEIQNDIEKAIYITRLAIGDLDEDGKAEIIVARKNEGLHAFNYQGTEIWFQPVTEWVRPLVVADFDCDGKNEIGEIGRDIKIRDKNGNILKTQKDSRIGEDFFFAPNENGRSCLQSISIYENKLTLTNEKNKIFETAAPLANIKLKEPRRTDIPLQPEMSFTNNRESVYQPQAVWLKLQKDAPPYLAVIASFISVKRANFYLYDSKGNLIYHELLPESAETIVRVPAANQIDNIFIGGEDKIWKFSTE